MKSIEKFYSARFVQTVAGLLVAVFGLSVMLGWQTGSLPMISLRPGYAPMVYNAALCFVLCGVTLILLARKFHRAALLTGLTVLVIGALTTVEYVGGVDFGIDQLLINYNLDYQLPNPGRMAFATAICFTLTGTTFLLDFIKTGRRLGTENAAGVIAIINGTLGAAVAATGTAVVMGYLMRVPTLYSWGIFSSMAMHSAGSFIFVGVGIIAQSWDNYRAEAKYTTRLLPVLAGLGVLALTLALYLTLGAQQELNIHQTVDGQARGLEYAVENSINARVLGIERMAERWTKHGGTSFEEWQADAVNYRRDFQTFTAIEWVDANLQTRFSEADGREKIDINFADEQLRGAMETAQRLRQAVVGQTVELPQGRGVLIYAPVYHGNGGESDGFIVGVSRAETLLPKILPDDIKNDYSISILEAGQPIYRTGADEVPGDEWQEQHTVKLPGTEWQASLTPRRATLAKFDSEAPESALAAGLFISFLLGWTIRLLQKSRGEIAEKIRAENELNQSETRLRQTNILQEAILDSANYTIIAASPEGLITAFNRTAEKWLGYRAEEVVGKMTPALIHDAGEVAAHTEELNKKLGLNIEPGFETFVTMARRGQVTEREWTYIRRDGSRFPVLLSVTTTRDEKGEITGFLGIGSDITERRQAEEKLRINEIKFKDLFDNAPVGYHEIDCDGRLVKVNNTELQMLGYEADEMIGQFAWEFVADPESRQRTLLKLRRNEPLVPYERTLRRKDGSLLHASFEERHIFDAAGRVIGIRTSVHDVTQRKKMEAELNQRQKLSRTLIGSLPQTAVVLFDTEMRYTLADGPEIEKNGFSRELFEGKTLREVFPPEIADVWEDYYGRALKGEYLSFEQHNEQHDKDFFLQISPVKNEAGEIFAGMVLWQDVTERKRTADALLETERRFRDFLNSSLAFFCTHTLDGTVLSVSPAAADSLGYEESELVGENLSKILLPEGRRLLPAYLGQLAADGESHGLMWIQTKTGERRIWSYNNVVRTGIDDQKYVLGSSQDITELKRNEEELEKSEKRFRSFLDNSPAVMTLKDEDGFYKVVNRPFEELMQVTFEELAGKTDFDLFPPEIAEMLRANDRKILETEQALKTEEFIPAPDGTPQFWLSHKFPLKDKTGKKFVGEVAINITERKKMEDELEQARDAALQSARLKSEFLANMSHEIRTPINGVIGMTSLLLDTGLTEEQHKFAGLIQTSGESLLEIINDILDFSKIEAGKLDFETIDFDLRHTVESIVEMFAEPAARKNIEIAAFIESGAETALRGDPGRLRQVINNLVGNALKFTESGEVLIRVRKEKETKENIRFRFEIVDTGIGIAPEAQQRLFQAFTQADGSTTRKYGGTGLGLAISKQLIERMNGDISVKSEPGKGTTFIFTAGFAKQKRPAEKPAQRRNLTGARVIIVDDNATNRKILTHQTESLGMIAAEAASGIEALQKIRRAAENGEPYDLAILDLMMPQMDGFELARLIKTDDSIKNTSLILMPSFGQRGDTKIARETGIAGYLLKPVKQEDLVSCIARVLSETSFFAGDHSEKSGPALVTRHTLREETAAESNQNKSTEARILVAEDNSINQIVVKTQLKRLGYEADIVENGRLAVEAVQQKNYALVLMDCQMPEMDGYTAVGEIRRNEADGRHIPVVALTANAMNYEREKCLAAGMDDYLAKPFKQADLEAMIKHWIKAETLMEEKSKTESEPAAAAPTAETGDDSNSRIKSELDHDVRDRLEKLESDIGEEIIMEIIDVFIENSMVRIEKLQEAIKNGDPEMISREAHSFKGSSLNLGANYIADLCARIEAEAESGRLAETTDLMNKIELSFPALIEVLRSLQLQKA